MRSKFAAAPQPMTPEILPNPGLHKRWTGLLLSAATLFAAPFFYAPRLRAQSELHAQSGTAHHRARPHAGKPAEIPQPAPAVPVEPPLPKWPVNDPPAQPSVTWDSQGLRVQATNSSLHQILNEVATNTGTKIEGFGQDQRVFGVYGPGQARDVLSQILTGSGYNVLMIGDMGQGAPRQIILSSRTGRGAQPNPNPPAANTNPPDEDQPEQPEPDEQQQLQQQQMMQQRTPMPPPEPMRSPQERMQEMQRQQMEMQRQQQLQLQQMQQQQQQQPQSEQPQQPENQQ